MFYFFLGCLFPISLLLIWKLLKLAIGWGVTNEYMVNPYSNSDDTDKDVYFRDIVKSVNLVIPMYPIQKRRNIRVLLDIQTKVPEKIEEFESEEMFISRFYFYEICGGIVWWDFISVVVTMIRSKLAIRKMLKEIEK